MKAAVHTLSPGKPASFLASKLTSLVNHGAPADDSRVIEARKTLAYHRVLRVTEVERSNLSPADAFELQRLIGKVPVST